VHAYILCLYISPNNEVDTKILDIIHLQPSTAIYNTHALEPFKNLGLGS